MSRTVAIVGRPNVGKSRLFNRLVRKRISIVHDQPGVTRDVISAEIEEGTYTLLDTGGLGLKGGETPQQLIKAAEDQVAFAIDTADLILFVVDGIAGLTELDTRVGDRLRRSGKKVVVVANKADFGLEKIQVGEFQRLGFGDPAYVSAEHGYGDEYLRNLILERLGPITAAEAEAANKTARDPLCVCFVGRPNVGKSSLSNRLLQSDRLVVSEIPGTTRDSIELPFEFKGRDGKMYPFLLIDTAGIKAQTKVGSPVEYFSRLRSLDALKRSDVVFLVVDALDGITAQDKAIAGEVVKEGKPVVVVVNKWDLVHEAFENGPGIELFESERDYREKYEKALFEQLFFTPGAPLVFVSAMSGYEVDRMLNAAVKMHRALDTKLKTSLLNQVLIDLTERTPPPHVRGTRFRVYYATQTGNRPFRIRIFCNQERKLSESYRRYLEKGIIQEFGLDGCPMHFDCVGKDKTRREPGGRRDQETFAPRWKQAEAERGGADETVTSSDSGAAAVAGPGGKPEPARRPLRKGPPGAPAAVPKRRISGRTKAPSVGRGSGSKKRGAR